MIAHLLAKTLICAAVSIPLQSKERWELEPYSNIPSNELHFSPEGLKVRVRASASPIIYPLNQVTEIQSLKVSGQFLGLPKFKDPLQQGSKGFDDYALRIGIVVPGDKELSGIKKIFAPAWIKKLYSKVPAGMGLDHIHFFNITQNAKQLGSMRIHPLSDLIQEEFIAQATQSGPFAYEYTLTKPLKAVAVWISIDGDDTKSDYEVLLSSLQFAAP